MAAVPIAPEVFAIPLGPVNAFLIQTDHLTLIDTGLPGSGGKILDAVRGLGRRPADIRHILVTHCHPDHSGSLAEMKAATGARACMHASDAALVRSGIGGRPMTPAPGLITGLLFKAMLSRVSPSVPAAEIEHEAADGETLSAAGGIQAFHTPGHTAGHLIFLLPRHGGVLFTGDAAANMLGLGLSLGYENLDEGRRSLAAIAALEFAVAGFGHGRAITRGAADRFRRKWSAR